MTDTSDPYENTPTAMVYDVFAETANELIGRYTSLSDAAGDAADRERWWALALAVRDTRRSVPAQAREQLLQSIARWKADIKALEAAG
ncbi:hypothetical protein ACH4U5_31080 [Streptomyces sp. NPDC020858]|uniref:hypothetical protein n=1 Tax=Streptomyces sp. NPDC020858 TaxID=3365097 RepID=UPI003793A681